jgi:O-antigen/teichoic acid export membrane protein
MASAVARGSVWMLACTAATRAASFVAQIVLGWLLTKQDFGVYALAMSVATLAAVLKDGGVKAVLVQRQREYDRLIGPVFWMASAFNGATGLLIAGLAPLLARAYHEPRVAWLMLVVAASQPLSTPGAILTTRLQIDMRFREAAFIAAASSIVRYLGAVAFACVGFGAMSFVLPLPLLALVEWMLGWWFVRERPWSRAPRPGLWWPLFRDTRWALVATAAIAGANLGPNIVIGFLVPMNVVGVFFFAFQIVVQVAVMVASNVIQVLVAAFSRMGDDASRRRAGAERALRQVMFLSAPMCLGLAATFAPTEMLIWKGKWADAADAVQIIGLFYPAVMASTIAQAVLQARGQFRAWGAGLAWMAIATLAGAGFGAWSSRTAAGVAMGSGAIGGLVAMGVTVNGLRGIGVRAGELARAIAPPWLLAIAAAALAMNVDLYCLSAAHPLLRLLVSATVYGAGFGLLARVWLSDHLREALGVMPSRLRPLVAGALRLR